MPKHMHQLKLRRTIFVNLSTLVIFLSLFSARLAAEQITKIIAKVNNQAITSKDLDDYCEVVKYQLSDQAQDISCANKEFKKKALERLMDDKLILDEAKNEKIEIPLAAIDSRLGKMISAYPSREEFEKSLQAKGLNITLLKERIKEQILMRAIIEKYVKFFISVSPQEVSSYYRDNRDQFRSLARYVFYVAKAEDKKTLESMSQLIKGKGIIEASQEHKGILNKIEANKDELRAEFVEILESLAQGKYKVETIDESFYLIYLDEEPETFQLSLVEAKEAIYAYLWESKFKVRFAEWVDKLKEKSVRENYYE
jgi:hypothetical protein